jgi:hypothetical protein
MHFGQHFYNNFTFKVTSYRYSVKDVFYFLLHFDTKLCLPYIALWGHHTSITSTHEVFIIIQINLILKKWE